MLKNVLLFVIIWISNVSYGLDVMPFDYLYHGSPNQKITLLEPRSISVRDPKEGALLFATPSLKLASCYLFKWDDSWVHQSITTMDNGDFEVIMIISDRKRFELEDKGGAIYFVATDKFSYIKDKSLGLYEWTSNKPAKPILQLNFPSALKAMEQFGVKVYFK